MKISFREFNSYLQKEGYTKQEIKHLFNAVKSMDSESRGWVIKWFNTGAIPNDEIEGVSAKYLIQECGYKVMNAFIILDWLKTDPQAAKYFILKIPSTISPSETIGPDIEKKMKEYGITINDINAGVDLSDITL